MNQLLLASNLLFFICLSISVKYHFNKNETIRSQRAINARFMSAISNLSGRLNMGVERIKNLENEKLELIKKLARLGHNPFNDNENEETIFINENFTNTKH